MARRKRYKKKDLMLFLGLSVVSILLIIIYYAYSSGDPYNKVKIDKRLEIIYPVYEKDDYIVPAININDENINIINQEIVNKANTYYVTYDENGYAKVRKPKEKKAPYDNLIELAVLLEDGKEMHVTDYASAGKLWTEESKMAAWMLTK